MPTLRPYQLQALEAEARHRAEHPDETPEPTATVRRGATGKAVDVWVDVLSSGGN